MQIQFYSIMAMVTNSDSRSFDEFIDVWSVFLLIFAFNPHKGPLQQQEANSKVNRQFV